MRSKLLTMVVILGIAVNCASTQSTVGAANSPREVLDRFCELDAEGKLLSPEGSTEANSLFISPYQWSVDRTITIIKDYVVRSHDMHGNTANFTVDYREWGQLDSSLRFTREEGMVPGEPINIREYFLLNLTNRFNEYGENGRQAVVRGPLSWRIEATPSGPRVSIDTAIRYVTEERDKSNDPLIKENADKTISALKGLLVGATPQHSANPGKTPKAVLIEFCKMDADGRQLASDGWREMSALFVQPGRPQGEKTIVVKDFMVSNASISDENKAQVFVEYVSLGRLDSSTALFEQGAMSGVKEREEYQFVLTNKNGQLVSASIAAQRGLSAPEWRIQGPLRNPRITVDTAVRYVTEMRERANYSVIKKNANQTLAKLKSLR